MMQKQVRNFVAVILFFIKILQTFSFVNLGKSQPVPCFIQIGIYRKFVNPYKKKIIVGPYSHEKTCKIVCYSQGCYFKSKQSSCNRGNHSSMLRCNCCATNCSSYSSTNQSSYPCSNSCINSCPKTCSASCFKLNYNGCICCPNFPSKKSCVTILPGFQKNLSSMNCKCCTQLKISNKPDKLKNEDEVFAQFNESSEITTESEISETVDNFELKINKTSNPNEAKFSYDVSVNSFMIFLSNYCIRFI
ncbi:uncharacterized protein ELE39_001761 [Cryptosporidium sp. chipmunk genotype I]|uniref:uncharacterized protein n=1 Tax=Cryptosporidium sp. chipmunk genotype I TaxID=1280935 RepID=UPI00351A400E|nr:hypothetical protein ELE39_001761 [Cryptosporidium sp. chipmunk genotype I]